MTLTPIKTIPGEGLASTVRRTTSLIPSVRVSKDKWGDWAVASDHGVTTWHTWREAMEEADLLAKTIRAALTPLPKWQVSRRLKALQAIGYGPAWIGGKLGIVPARVADLTHEKSDCSPALGRKIKKLYAWVDEYNQGRVVCDPTEEAAVEGWATPADYDNIDRLGDVGSVFVDNPLRDVPVRGWHHTAILLLRSQYGSDDERPGGPSGPKMRSLLNTVYAAKKTMTRARSQFLYDITYRKDQANA